MGPNPWWTGFLQYLPMSRRGDEVQAALHSVVWHLPPVDPGLCVEEIFELAVDVVGDRLPAGDTHSSRVSPTFDVLQLSDSTVLRQASSPVTVVDGVAEAGGVDDGEQEMDPSFLY